MAALTNEADALRSELALARAGDGAGGGGGSGSAELEAAVEGATRELAEATERCGRRARARAPALVRPALQRAWACARRLLWGMGTQPAAVLPRLQGGCAGEEGQPADYGEGAD